MNVTITLDLNGVPVPVTLDEQALAVIAAALPDPNPNGTSWLSGAQAAADYLSWPRERVYKRLSELPHYREGARLMFRRDELDRYIENS